jgi:hypothetical protein
MSWLSNDPPEVDTPDLRPAELAIRQDMDYGTESRWPNGQLKKGFSANPHPTFTKENAVQMARRRVELAKERARKGMEDAMQELIDKGNLPKTAVSAEGWRYMIGHATKVYMETDSARGIAELGTFIGRNTGEIMDASQRIEPEEHGPFGLEDALLLLTALDEYKKRKEAIDVVARD